MYPGEHIIIVYLIIMAIMKDSPALPVDEWLKSLLGTLITRKGIPHLEDRVYPFPFPYSRFLFRSFSLSLNRSIILCIFFY